MAAGEVTGATEDELETLEGQHYNQPQWTEHKIPFETAYCLTKIGKQPDEYDGPVRYCKSRVVKKDPEDYEGGEYSIAAYGGSCRCHGGAYCYEISEKEREAMEAIDSEISHLKHGAYAEDEHLMMDFTDEEQELFDSIMNDWPEIYDWPSESEDPARYRILRRVAVNEVRAIREEEYLDGQEVIEEPIYDEQGVQVGTQEVENPLAREYRLLMSEVTDQMKELGLTPKERQKMDKLASEADKDDAISEIAQDALNDGSQDYDPGQFE